jgi:hypothetical protein
MHRRPFSYFSTASNHELAEVIDRNTSEVGAELLF